jgi:hypothetical protein
MARTTTNLLDALHNAHSVTQGTQHNLDEVIPDSVVEKFFEAMRLGGIAPSKADEYYFSLRHSMKAIRELLDSLDREIGAAQHIIEAGVHKTPHTAAGHGRTYLMLQ